MRNNVLIKLGILCLVCAFGIVFRNVYQDKEYSQASKESLRYIQKNDNVNSDVVVYKGHAYLGYIVIEDLHLQLPVLNEYTYEDMALAPCRYAGSIEDKNLVICAHNSYSHFGRIKNVSIGSTIRIVSASKKVYTYKVKSIEILKANDIEKMKRGDWDLTLFTCTLDARNRVTVRCNLN